MKFNLAPTYYIDSVAHIDPSTFLEAHPDIKGIVWELYGTLTGRNDLRIPAAHIAVLKKISALGITQGVIKDSTTSERQVNRADAHARQLRSEVDHEIFMSLGLQRTQPATFQHAAEVAKLHPAEMAHVGDQLSGIRSANLAGYGASILVALFGESKSWQQRLQKPLEGATRFAVGVTVFGRSFPTQLNPPDERMAKAGAHIAPCQ